MKKWILTLSFFGLCGLQSAFACNKCDAHKANKPQCKECTKANKTQCKECTKKKKCKCAKSAKHDTVAPAQKQAAPCGKADSAAVGSCQM